ncbi:MAG: flagellar hook-basal body complex protein [Rhodospirillales bacterium]|jgi:flagellar basal-body rod protein FlgF|nr:flagellar hook-basal body complex protein [Rhodospirillales bacterium]
MDIASSIAASRLVAQSHAIEVVAGNIANASTPGYRAERVQFADWLSPQTNARTPPGGRVLSYTQDRATWLETAPGPLRHTGNPLDLAIAGQGYFTVKTKSGPRLTRDGKFGLLPDGTVADAAGNPLLDTAGQPIRVPTTGAAISVAGDGTISSGSHRIAQVGVVRPQDPLRLRAEGGTLLVADTPTTPLANPRIVQGALEGSNVQPITEMTRMLDISRQFQFVAQFVQAESTRHRNAIDKLLPTPGNLP